MKNFQNKVAVITGAASGFGLAFAKLGARHGMRLVLSDIQEDALEQAQKELHALGANVLIQLCDVSQPEQVQALAEATRAHFGSVHLLFNNAGVGAGGLIWENAQSDWEWVLKVNLGGVIHGVRIFMPLMLECARNESGYEGHIINTASIAGLFNSPILGLYNVSKNAVVAFSESLYHDLQLMNAPIDASVLCPYFVPTGIAHSKRNRSPDFQCNTAPTLSQQVAEEVIKKAVRAGKISADDIAVMTFDAIRNGQFYIFSHPEMLASVRIRMEDILLQRNPSDPYQDAPHLRAMLAEKLRG